MSDFPQTPAPPFLDDFSRDERASYTYEAGFGGVAGGLSIASGELVPGSASAWGLVATRGPQFANRFSRLKWKTGNPAGGYAGLIMKWLGQGDMVWGRVTAGGSAVEIRKSDAGVGTLLATISLTGFAVSTYYWVAGFMVGNTVRIEHRLSDPAIDMTLAAKAIDFTLTGADATKFGSGVKGFGGFAFVPSDTAQRADDFLTCPSPWDALTA